MQLNCVCDTQLPKLAWLAILEKGCPDIRIIHGEWVETGDHFVFEGAWASDFPSADFDQSETVFGSGVVVRDNRAVFCSPSHTLSRLNVLQQRHSMFISNSFVFCLTAAGRKLRKDYALYFRDFQSIVRGLRKHKKQVPLDEGVMELLYVDNLIVSPDLRTEVMPKFSSPAFSSYEEYHGYLEKTIKDIGENTVSPSRAIQYEPISTISSGYDSPASSVLAQAIGCHTAITFPNGRGHQVNDSGDEIGKQLGYSIIEADRGGYRNMRDCPEAEFVAGGMAGDGGDVIFAPLQELLTKKVLVSGFFGGDLWRRNTYPKRAIQRTDLGGSLMDEFRLRVGFVHLPVPFIGCLRGPDLNKISRSPKMDPWSTGNNYDNPIARRIVEEAGVPRACFGQKKKAAGARFFDGPNRRPEDLKLHLSPSSYRDYQQYFINHYKPNRQEVHYALIAKFRRFLDKICILFNRSIGWRFGIQEFHPKALRHYDSWIGKNWLLFHWAVEKTAERYENSSQAVASVSPSKSLKNRTFQSG